jgi:glutaminyl-tRNA synthetase
LCDALEVYKPRQYEFARLNLQGTFLSKRKIARLVTKNLVEDWDDPRLYTIIALRRRGVPPGALLRFVSELGVTTFSSTTPLHKFDATVRSFLEDTAPRLMMCLNPIKVIIDNVADDYSVEVDVPLHPKIPAMGSVTSRFCKEFYIDAEDFREEDSKDYFRLAPGKSVGLFRAPAPVTCTTYTKDPETGRITEIRVNLEDAATAKKAKAYVQWVNAKEAVHIDQVRYFHPLFHSDPPPAEFEADVSPNSVKVYTNAVVEPAFYELAQRSMREAKAESEERTDKAKKEMAGQSHVKGDEDEPVVAAESLYGVENIRFQGMRLAYFALDRESVVASLAGEGKGKEGDKIVLNRIVSLKEDTGKKA